MFLPFQWLLYEKGNDNQLCSVCFCIKGTLNCLTLPTGWRSTPTMDEFPQLLFWTESLPMLKTTSTMPHLWPLTTVGATVFVCVYMQKQLRSSDSIDFGCREKLQPNKLMRYTHAHTSMLMITPTTYANSFRMSTRSLSLGCSLKQPLPLLLTHTYAHTLPAVWKSLQKSARPYSAVVFNILTASELWNKPPLSHTRCKFESLSTETLTKQLCHFYMRYLSAKTHLLSSLNALK